MAEIVPARAGSSGKHFRHGENCTEYIQQTNKKDTQEGRPRQTTTDLARDRKRVRTSSQNASNIVPESSERPPQSSQRAPEEHQRASQEPPDVPTELLKLPRAVQGASKGSPRVPFGNIWNDFGFKMEVSGPMLTQFLS